MFKGKKVALVCGAGGFIGSHLVKRLKSDRYIVIGLDMKNPEFSKSEADFFVNIDLRSPSAIIDLLKEILFYGVDNIEEFYQLAADMGGAGFVFTGENDTEILFNNALINLNILNISKSCTRFFYSSSACIYPAYNQTDPNNPKCSEDSAYPAAPDSEYGWEKLFSERLYMAARRNFGRETRIARFHNIYGPEGTWTGGREKAPAALCRKVAMAKDGDEIEIWGDGEQTRSFLYIDDCIEGIIKLTQSEVPEPLNIGSEEMISINNLANLIIGISGKNLILKHIEGPQGVRGRNSDNRLVKEKIGWEPTTSLSDGIFATYQWVQEQVEKSLNR